MKDSATLGHESLLIEAEQNSCPLLSSGLYISVLIFGLVNTSIIFIEYLRSRTELLAGYAPKKKIYTLVIDIILWRKQCDTTKLSTLHPQYTRNDNY